MLQCVGGGRGTRCNHRDAAAAGPICALRGRMLVHLLPITAAACALLPASTQRTVLTRRGALLGAGALVTAAPASTLALGKTDLIEDLTSGMRAELQTRFSAGPSKTVLVTGAKTKAGFDAAKRAASDGARVIVTAESQAQADELAAQLRESTGAQTVFSMQLSLTNRDSLLTLPARLAKTLGASKPIDCLMDNAGILPVVDPTSESDPFNTAATLFYCKTS